MYIPFSFLYVAPASLLKSILCTKTRICFQVCVCVGDRFLSSPKKREAQDIVYHIMYVGGKNI